MSCGYIYWKQSQYAKKFRSQKLWHNQFWQILKHWKTENEWTFKELFDKNCSCVLLNSTVNYEYWKLKLKEMHQICQFSDNKNPCVAILYGTVHILLLHFAIHMKDDDGAINPRQPWDEISLIKHKDSIPFFIKRTFLIKGITIKCCNLISLK